MTMAQNESASNLERMNAQNEARHTEMGKLVAVEQLRAGWRGPPLAWVAATMALTFAAPALAQ